MSAHDFTIRSRQPSHPIVPIVSPIQKYVLPIEREQNKCFKCQQNRTGEAFICNQLMNICIICRTVWPKEGDTKNFGELPPEQQVKGTTFFFGVPI